MNLETRLETMIKDLETLISEIENELSSREKDEKLMWDFASILRLRTSLRYLKASEEKMNTALDILRKKTNVLCGGGESRAHCLGKTILFEYLSKGDEDSVPYPEVSFKLGKSTYKADILTKIGGRWNIIEIETNPRGGENHIINMTKLKNNLVNIKFPHAGAPDTENLKEQIRNESVIFHVGYTEKPFADFIDITKNVYGSQINLKLYYVDIEHKTVTEL